MSKLKFRTIVLFLLFLGLAAGAFTAQRVFGAQSIHLPVGMGLFDFIGLILGVAACVALASLVTQVVVARKGKPAAEAAMIGRLFWLLGFVCVVLCVTYGFGVLKTFGTVMSVFGGMFLGWSLQAPVSGFAAFLLVSLKRPFRPGDRVQFPNLNLTGDIKEIGAMYTVLDQVGGSIGSEEAVGRYILVPNAMLFTQVAINYTITQHAAYMLDEVVIRITFDSDWNRAETILLKAANEVVKEVIEATGEKPYIRADPYDYGVYLRLRYKTRVKDRAEIGYKINKLIFEEIQRTPCVDLAIPFIYSNRAGQDKKEEGGHDKDGQTVVQVPVDRIKCSPIPFEAHDVEQLVHSIRREGLLQPVIVVKPEGSNDYELLAGHLRLEACRKLGWKSVPALIRNDHSTGK